MKVLSRGTALLGLVCGLAALPCLGQLQPVVPPGTAPAPIRTAPPPIGVTPQTLRLPLRGFVDLHTHPLANLAFGGKFIYGGVDFDPAGNGSIEIGRAHV